MEITKAKQTDYPQLVEVWEASVRATHGFVTEADLMYFKTLVPQYFDAVDLVIVSEVDQILGFLGTGDNEIQMLFLRPEARGKGIGRFLVQLAIDEHQVNKVEVNEQNLQAVGFYEYMGFKIAGRTDTDYHGKPYPLLKMQL